MSTRVWNRSRSWKIQKSDYLKTNFTSKCLEKAFLKYISFCVVHILLEFDGRIRLQVVQPHLEQGSSPSQPFNCISKVVPVILRIEITTFLGIANQIFLMIKYFFLPNCFTCLAYYSSVPTNYEFQKEDY